ncbi:MSHA biogenesis protein MshP [Telluria mixta]|uniref:MSHA biogenesis protein MshP n=1 Tax=Telluria mixta TaxID=34071 RepID=A0ABT2C7B4_9BURK|nr:MSHA biogenesis protein MshP [Telluria mixta]MCS0633296.1 MSHA biogenesis protein MshP [Telluria mixta]WEM94776.1 MSHA biogenesis protein MshP [Telluria mixta]
MTARRAGGFAYIAAIVFLVVLAGFALAVLRLSDTEQTTVNQAVLGARASQAARTGLEWAFYKLKPKNANCATLNPAPDFKTDTGFTVTIECSMQTYDEGLTPAGASVKKNIFELKATACNGATCPGSNTDLANPDYIERKRTASICVAAADGTDCY